MSQLWRLYDNNEFFMGTLQVPSVVDNRLYKEGQATIIIRDWFPLKYPSTSESVSLQEAGMIQHAQLARVPTKTSYRGDEIRLFGATIEELEIEPGFLFTPSVSYVMRKLEDAIKATHSPATASA